MNSVNSKNERQWVLEKIRRINVWKRGERLAPHKPLLLLLALARISRGEPREVHYPEVDEKLGGLLREFAPARKSVHPEYPFWRLQNDGIWIVRDAESLERRTGKDDPKKSELMRYNIAAGFTPEVDLALRNDPSLLYEAAKIILESHFPTTIHEDILNEVGLTVFEIVRRRTRDPKFRERVLRAYRWQCAVCGFDVRLGNQPIAIEAAHIKWHQAGGLDTEPNGLALCSLHHKMFDRGAYTLSPGRRIRVSESACGSQGLNESLLQFQDQPLRKPQAPDYLASRESIAWHSKEVFRGV